MKKDTSSKKNLVLQNIKEKENFNINFVCSGNIIRSPYAELLFEHIINNDPILHNRIKVESSAVIYRNTHISIETRNELIKEGISTERINQFKPRYFKDIPDIYERADIILVMEEEHIHKIPIKFYDKTFLLLEFTDGLLKSVPDPYFNPPYERSFRMIKNSLYKLLKLFNEN